MRRRALGFGTQVAVTLGGVAALSWEIVWQVHAALSLGVSALGTALTLAATMGGMTLGSLAMGRALRGRSLARPLRVYGALEAVVGVSGLLLGVGFAVIEALGQLGHETWFRLGDRDFATCHQRTLGLRSGLGLARVTDGIRCAFGVEARIVCESPSLEYDALIMQKAYRKLNGS